MNTSKLMAVALCATACVSTTAFADDGDIVSAANATTIADPVNPRPGMVFRGYNINYLFGAKFNDLPALLEKVATVKSTVATSERFSFEEFTKNVGISQGVWEGFLKCKRSANCTILMQQQNYHGAGFILIVNGKRVISGEGQASATVDLKAGFNHIKIVTQTKTPVAVFLSPTGSTKEPKPLSPGMMFYDDKPEDDVL